MKTKDFFKHIEAGYKKGVEIIKLKNKDYANSDNPFKNFDYAELVGVSPERAILVRISDKLARVSNLLQTEASVKDEAIEDTILDMINYLAILRAKLYDNKTGTKGGNKKK